MPLFSTPTRYAYVCVTVIENLDSLVDPREEALSLIEDLVQVRTKYTLENVLKHAFNKITESSKLVRECQNDNTFHNNNDILHKMIEKDGWSMILGKLADIITQNEKYSQEMIELIHTCIIFDFNSKYWFSRAGAFRIIAQFDEIIMQHSCIKENSRRLIINGCLQCLADKNKPLIKVEACNAIARLVLHDNGM